jgi:hypothetical protein
LLERGFDFKSRLDETPLYAEYYRYQLGAIRAHFAELADYARSYGRSVGREVLVSGNFFNMDPQYLGLVDDVDLIVTEMRNTTHRQPEWFRYVAGFAGDKDVIVVENPYGGVVPALVSALKEGRGYDLFRLSLFEAAAFGVNMSVPYGSWMGATIEDAFYAPHELAADAQAFLAEHERFFARRTVNEVAVVYGVESNRELIARADVSDNLVNARDESVVVPYRQVTLALAGAGVPFDVVIFPDSRTAPDRVTAETLRPYGTVLLPHCSCLSSAQEAALASYADGGGRVIRFDAFDRLEPLLPDGRQVVLDGPGVESVAVNTAALADGAVAVHLVNYGYDAELDRVRPTGAVTLDVRLPGSPAAATAYASDGGVTSLPVTVADGRHRVALDGLGPYTIVVFG